MRQRLVEVALGGAELALLAAICWAIGNRLWRCLDRGEPRPGRLDAGFRIVLETLAGILLLHLLLSVFDLTGIRWRVLPLLVAVVALGAGLHLCTRWRRGRDPRPAASPVGGARSRGAHWGWGDSVAALALALFGLWAAVGWAVNPDFIYHWGIKGHRFYLAGGIDVAFLVQPWTRLAHPGYPHLLPGLFAATALAGGGFREAAMFGWSALFAVAGWPAARQAARAAGAGRFATQAAVAAVGLTAAMFGIGYLLAGGPDTLIALVPLAAWPAMLAAGQAEASAPTLRTADWQIGLLAALAAGAKIEGMVLAAALVGVYLASLGRPLWRWREGASFGAAARVLARTSLPAAAVVALWGWRGVASGLFGTGLFGSDLAAGAGWGLHWQRWPTVLAAAARAAALPEWHGVAWVVALLPLLLFVRRARPVAAVCALQLTFYLAVYLVSPAPSAEAVRFYVASSFPRLLYHLVPATLVAVFVALDGWAGRPAEAPVDRPRA
jgi:hypothetical protein